MSSGRIALTRTRTVATGMACAVRTGRPGGAARRGRHNDSSARGRQASSVSAAQTGVPALPMQLLVARSGVMRPGASRDFCATAGAAKIQSAATSKNARMERKRWSEMTNAETASASALDRMLLLQAAPGKGAPENSDAPVDRGAARPERRGEAYR